MSTRPTYQQLEDRIQLLEQAELKRQNAESALKESEIKLRNTLDNMMEGCQILGYDWRYLYVNDSVARHARLRKDELLGRRIMDVFPGVEQTTWFAVLRRCMKERVQHQMENEFTYPDGSTGWFELSIEPVPEGIFILSFDISTRKQAEEALRQSEKRLIEAQRIAKMGDFTWDVQTGVVTWSEALVDLLQYDKGEKIDYNRVNSEIHHPDDLERVTRWLTDSISSGKEELTPNEYRIVTKEGNIIWVRTVGRIEREQGKKAKIFATIQDITERKSAEEALQDSESRYRNLFMYSPDAILVDQHDRITLVNEACLNLFGAKTPEELTGRPTTDLFPSGFNPRALKHIHQPRLLSDQASPVEEKIIRLDGETLEVEVLAASFQFGGVKAIHLILRDITERKRTEEDREKLRMQLTQAQKMESIGRLAGGVAHDLNNLLSPILGYGEILLEDLDPDDMRRNAVDEILRAGLLSRDLVRQLLAFSRKQALAFNPLDLNKTIEGFNKLLRRTIPEDIAIETLLSRDIRPVMADLGQIEQVIMNLAVNAADAMPNGGTLTIETALTDLDEAYSAKHLEAVPGRYVMLALSDTGNGMDEEIRQRIFEPFFSTKGERGTGLGLATVYGIVKQHGGNIWVYSEMGKGTTFKIYLPVTDQARLEEKTGQIKIGEVSGSETIVLVEDNDEVRQLAQVILQRLGYKVLVANGAAESFAAMETHPGPIHLLLTDVVMPDMNGRELYNHCAEKYPDLKVLYMSGYTDNVIAHRGVLDKGIHFIQKPFSVQALALKVREVLEQ